jgi:hypothetical protein
VGFVSNSRGIGSCVSGTPSFEVSFPQFSWEPRRDENKTLVSTESEEFPLLHFSVKEIELPRTEDGTSLSPIPMSQTLDKEKFRLLSEEVQSLLLKNVIEEIPPTQSTPGFYSRHKLVNFVVPDKSEKFPGSQRNWDMEISIRKVQFGGQHTWKNTSSDRSVGLHFEMGNRKVTVGCTTGFYSGFSDGYSSPAYSVNSSSFLSGRFSSEGIRFRNSFSSHFPVYQTSSGPRLPYFLEKVSDTSFPRLNKNFLTK